MPPDCFQSAISAPLNSKEAGSIETAQVAAGMTVTVVVEVQVLVSNPSFLLSGFSIVALIVILSSEPTLLAVIVARICSVCAFLGFFGVAVTFVTVPLSDQL